MSKTRLGVHRKQLKKLSRQLREELLKSANEITAEASLLMHRIRVLIQHIRGVMSRREIARILGAAAVFFGIGYSADAGAQNFAPAVSNPFGLLPNNYVNIPTAVDIDGDGDLDIMAGALDLSGYYNLTAQLEFYENTGTAQAPQFGTRVVDTFNIDLSPINSYVVIPTFGDLDNDGDLDLILGGSYQGFFYYENTGTAQSPTFGPPQDDPFGLSDSVYYGSPILLDLDDDGDLDILSGEYDGRIVYYENLGTASAPAFGPKQYEPFGLQTSYYAFPTAGDVDWDGDLDIIIGDYYGDMHYFENTGSKTNPQFAAPVTNPSNIQSSNYISFPLLADMDGDTDPDLMIGIGTYYTGVGLDFYENIVTGISIDENETGTDVYPTLVKDFVRLDSDKDFVAIQLLDMSGNLVRSWSGDTREFNLKDLPSGAYLLQMTTEHHRLVQKKLVRE